MTRRPIVCRLFVLIISFFLAQACHHEPVHEPSHNITKPPIYPVKITTLLTIEDNVYGVRNVSYWVTEDGLAIIDGDVIYGTLQDLIAHNFTGQGPITRRAHSIYPTANTWPSATIKYNFDSNSTEQLLQSIVNGAIANWKATASYLTFTKVANNAGLKGVATVKAPSCGGCNTAIGFFNSPITMNLQQTCPSSPGSCGVWEATHEFGHVLGLYHEHQRVDRERVVHYNCSNLGPTCPSGTTMPAGKTCCDTGIPSGCCTLAGNFNILSESAFDASGQYDIHSIMQYRRDAFAKPGTDTLTPAAAGIMVPAFNPSAIDATDFTRVCKLYSAKCPKAQQCRAQGCTTTCQFRLGCNKPSLCDNPRTAPPCCAPLITAACKREMAACTAKGCDFLI